ncbi:hypothetical protein L484_015656 [Morus notabilis]|uniref:Uncharacterized protein n=1 Tax=Morus notabilis TaxID=981085 RepID=W9RLF9_9ROSA|nr:hypothetical protein L484_015656 [Morus notabilis]
MGSMREKKDIGGIEREAVTLITELESSFKHVAQRLNQMKQYKDSGSVKFEDLEILKILEETTRKTQETFFAELSQLLKDILDCLQNPKIRKASHRTYTSHDIKSVMEKIKMSSTGLQSMLQIVDKLEEKFLKYNVPKRNAIDRSTSGTSFDRHLERLREFMQVTWKERAEKCRRKEHRSLIEWMGKLEETEDQQKRNTFKALRVVLIDTGIKISHFLIEYLLIMSVSSKEEEISVNLFEVETTIRCLSTEENSIVINSFLSVVKLFNRMMRTMMKPKTKVDMIKKDDSKIEEDNEVLHLIIIEVLRLEVGFCYPDLPMMVSNEVFLAMGQHLMDNVFEDKLNRLRAKIDGLKIPELLSDGDDDSMRKRFKKVLNFGAKEIWNQVLDSKPRT